MKTGVEAIAQEREDAIKKHGYTAAYQAGNPEYYSDGQLIDAARHIGQDFKNSLPQPAWWPKNWDKEWYMRLCQKPLVERLAIAGQFYAAEIDRRLFIDNMTKGTVFVKKMIKDTPPVEPGVYMTNEGLRRLNYGKWYTPEDTNRVRTEGVEWWLCEVKLPSENEITEALKHNGAGTGTFREGVSFVVSGFGIDLSDWGNPDLPF